jgi:hypothetical protein
MEIDGALAAVKTECSNVSVAKERSCAVALPKLSCGTHVCGE